MEDVDSSNSSANVSTYSVQHTGKHNSIRPPSRFVTLAGPLAVSKFSSASERPKRRVAFNNKKTIDISSRRQPSSLKRTCAVASVAWPQSGTSVFGVNQRSDSFLAAIVVCSLSARTLQLAAYIRAVATSRVQRETRSKLAIGAYKNFELLTNCKTTIIFDGKKCSSLAYVH